MKHPNAAVELSARLLQKRMSFVKTSGLRPPIDYLPDDHWIRNRLRTNRFKKLLIGLDNTQTPYDYFWNVYGENR